MASVGTVTFRPNVEDIITEAFERCGMDPQVQTGYKALSARRSLNLLFSEWANRGINYWALKENTLDLEVGQIEYILPGGTIDILSAVIRENSGTNTSDQIVNRISITEYNQLPNKNSPGKPSQYMLDKQYTPIMHVWQVPDQVYSINYWSMNQLQDITVSNQDAEVPYRWNECICAGLASKLALKFASEKFTALNDMYERAFEFASARDNDGTSLRIQPTMLNLY